MTTLSESEIKDNFLKLAETLILNLIKSRNDLQVSFACEVLPPECIQNIEETTRNKFTEAELGHYIGELFSWFPEIKWTEDNISDALYCDRLDITAYLQKLNNNKTNN